jgi:hypothetical protein
MKLLNKILITIAAYLVIAIIIDACHPCPHCDYDILGISLKNLIYRSEKCLSCTDETDTSVIKYSKYGIRINFSKTLCSNMNQRLNLIKTASAVDCWITYTLKHNIDSIEIYSLDEFDSSHKGNSDISSYFRAINYSGYTAPTICSIDSLLSDSHNINSAHNLGVSSIDLLLTKPPQNDSLFRFVIKIKLTDKVIMDTTNAIRISK